MTIKPLGDRIAVELLPGEGKVGDLFVSGQTFCRAKVYGIGQDALGMRGVLLYEEVVVSEYFGDEVRLDVHRGAQGGTEGEQVLHVGRLRDIVGVFRNGVLKPPGDRVHVRRLDPPKMAGVLHLPEDQHGAQFEAEVLAVGPDVECGLLPGRRVLVPRAVSVEVRLPDGNRFHLVDEPALLAILE